MMEKKAKKLFVLSMAVGAMLTMAGCSKSNTTATDGGATSIHELTEYQQDGIEGTINNRFNEAFGLGHFDRVKFDDMTITFDGDIITAKMTVRVHNSDGANDYIPAEFDLEYNKSSAKYEITYADFDEDAYASLSDDTNPNSSGTASTNSETGNGSNVSSNSSNTSVNTNGATSTSSNEKSEDITPSEVEGLTKSGDTYDVNVNSSITVITKVPAGARVVTTATNEDGEEFVVADMTTGSESTQTKSLPAGKYTVAVYSEGGGWSWEFTCQ